MTRELPAVRKRDLVRLRGLTCTPWPYGQSCARGQEAAVSVAARRKRAMAGDRDSSGQAAAIVLGLRSVRARRGRSAGV
jgi:hypothetical protein